VLLATQGTVCFCRLQWIWRDSDAVSPPVGTDDSPSIQTYPVYRCWATLSTVSSGWVSAEDIRQWHASYPTRLSANELSSPIRTCRTYRTSD
jgi:hypothetical protein